MYYNMKTVEMKRSKKRAVTVSFRCPEDLHASLERLLTAEDLDFSKLCRRALRREMEARAK